MKTKKSKKFLTIFSIVSLGMVATASLVPIVNNSLQNDNTVSSKVNLANDSRASYNGITNIAPEIQATSDLSSYYPYELYSNSSLMDNVKSLIISQLQNPAGVVTNSDIDINRNYMQVDNLHGRLTLIFTLKNYKAVVYTNGAYDTVQSLDFTVTITNLNIAVPSNIPANNSSINVVGEYASLSIVEAEPLLVSDIIPSIIGGTQSLNFSVILNSYTFLFPTSIEVSVVINNYFDTNGNFVSDNFTPVTFTVTGFKSLSNSSVKTIIDGSSLGLYANQITLANTFELIKENISNLSSELTIDDISNFEVTANLISSSATVNFDINNNLWVENGLVNKKNITITITQLKIYTYTTINNVLTEGLGEFTSSYLQNSAPNGDWTKNTTIKSIIASSILNSNDNAPVYANNIDIVSVTPQNYLNNGNYEKLLVNFNLNNSLGINENGEIVQDLPLQTTLTGFKANSETTINSQILAKYSDSSSSNTLGYRIYDNIYASNITELQLRNIIAGSFVSPESYIYASDIVINSTEVNNSNGTIVVNFTLNNNKYVDINGNSLPSKDFVVTIFGFKIFTGATIFDLSDNMTIPPNAFLTTDLIIPANSLAGQPNQLIAMLRSFVRGPVASSFSLNVSNIQVGDDETSLSLNVSVSNYLNENGAIVTTPRVFTNIQFVNLPATNPPQQKTYTYPVIKVENGTSDSTLTIDDYRPTVVDGVSDYFKLQTLIANNLRPSSYLPTDIQIVSANFSAISNSIDVTYRVINNKYNDGSNYLAVSPDLKVKIVGFASVNVVNSANYTINTINNPSIGETYASEFLSELKLVQDYPDLSKSEKLTILQILLSKYVSLNLSNLNPEYTSFAFTANDSNIINGNATGTLTIELYSGNYYNQSGIYVESSATPIVSYTLSGFAAISNYAATKAVVLIENSETNPLDIFANEINLDNINDFIDIDNLPVNANPQYIIDVKETNSSEYGMVDVTILLSSKFDSNGQLLLPTTDSYFTERTITLYTKPFLNTTIVGGDSLVINVEGLYSDRKPSSLNEEFLQELISSKLTQKPSNFSTTDIKILNYSVDDENGSITVSFEITNYYNNGNLTLTPKVFNNVLIEGFRETNSIDSDDLPFYKQLWFFILIGATVLGLLILLLVFLFYKLNNNKKDNYYY